MNEYTFLGRKLIIFTQKKKVYAGSDWRERKNSLAVNEPDVPIQSEKTPNSIL